MRIFQPTRHTRSTQRHPQNLCCQHGLEPDTLGDLPYTREVAIHFIRHRGDITFGSRCGIVTLRFSHTGVAVSFTGAVAVDSVTETMICWNIKQNRTNKTNKQKKTHKTIFITNTEGSTSCLLYTSPSPRDQRGSRMPSSA